MLDNCQSEINAFYGRYASKENISIAEAKKRDMYIMMDIVANHTSSEHEWFKESRKSKDNPYRDYYIWRDEPLHNMGSVFGGSAWEYDETTNQYYFHAFAKGQPDLNWSNPKLREKMFEMAKWWLDKGVDGFRVDAVAHLSRDMTFQDSDMEHFEKYKPDWKFFSNRPELHNYLKEFNEKVFSKYDCMTVGEAGGGATPRQALDYSGYDSHELDMTFTFDHCWENGAFGADTKKDEEIITNVISLKDVISKWQLGLYGKGWNPIYWLNHDHPRVASQYGDINYHKESCKMLCNTLGVNRSGFYKWKHRLEHPSDRLKTFAENILLFKEYHQDSSRFRINFS